MIATYIRSSSLGTLDICEHSYFLNYNLCIQTPPNEKASLGSVIHKAAELLCLRQLAKKANKDVVDAEDLGLIPLTQLTDEYALQISFKHYKEIEQSHWGDKEWKQIQKFWEAYVSYNDGEYYPDNMNVIACEQRFDFELEYDWAKYKYWLPDGKTMVGQLSLKGTMDIITEPYPNVINYVDLKTGSRNDWKMKYPKPKEYVDFYKDKQLLLYGLVLHRMYPNKDILMTIFYTNSGGAFELPFGPVEFQAAIDMLKENFEKINNIYYPKRKKTKYDPNPRWCENTCAFQKIMYKNTNINICDAIHTKLKTKKMAEVIVEDGNLDLIKNYGSGGGRSKKN